MRTYLYIAIRATGRRAQKVIIRFQIYSRVKIVKLKSRYKNKQVAFAIAV